MLDFFILAPLFQQLERQWSATDLTLRGRLGGGNFGEVYEGVINERQGALTALDPGKLGSYGWAGNQYANKIETS